MNAGADGRAEGNSFQKKGEREEQETCGGTGQTGGTGKRGYMWTLYLKPPIDRKGGKGDQG